MKAPPPTAPLPARAAPVNPFDISTSDQPVFDASVLGAMFGNDSAVIASVLETFLVSIAENLPTLAAAAATQNFDSVAALAHKIAGACRMSGAQALGYTAHSVEAAAKRGDADLVRQGMANLHSQWAQLQAVVDKLIRAKQP